jgi:Domain of unknown function (DUF4352)/zinc-ribbon domain
MADRYCKNCGQELPEDSRFCPNCGTPIQEAAHVPTPEADVPVPPPPQQAWETASPTPEQATPQPPPRSTANKVFVGCTGLVVVLVLFVGCLAVLGSGGGGGGGNSADSNNPPPAANNQEKPAAEKQQAAQGEQANKSQGKSYGIGDTVPVGDVSYRVTGAKRVKQLPDPLHLDPPMRGNFILITFVFTNNGNDPANVSDIGLYLYDSQGREFETDTDAAMNLPQDKSIYILDRVNPGLSRTVQTVYSVPPDARGFELEVTSGLWATESARINLGF